MMLKWKNMRTIVLLVAIIVGVSSVFIYLNVNRAAPSKAQNAGFLPPPVPISFLGQEVSLDQAQALVPFKISVPTIMGNHVEIRTDGYGHVAIIYAANEPSDDSTVDDLLSQNGIILFESPTNLTLQQSYQNILARINVTQGFPGALNLVSINGYSGCAGGGITDEVTWYTETTVCQLIASGNYPLQQVIAMARSIPVK